VPEFPVLGVGGEIRGDAYLVLLCILANPQDQVFAEDAYKTILLDALSKDDDGKPSRYADQAFEELSDGHVGAACAAEVLMNYMTLAVHHPERKSINHAWYMAHDALRNTETVGGQRLTCSPRTIRRYWTKYRSAAHLCAVHRIHFIVEHHPETYLLNKKLKGDVIHKFSKDILQCLQIAETMRGFAEAAGLSFGPDPWRAPDKLNLKRVPLNVPEYSDQERDVLNRFRFDWAGSRR
jgi:hypothetical protein